MVVMGLLENPYVNGVNFLASRWCIKSSTGGRSGFGRNLEKLQTLNVDVSGDVEISEIEVLATED